MQLEYRLDPPVDVALIAPREVPHQWPALESRKDGVVTLCHLHPGEDFAQRVIHMWVGPCLVDQQIDTEAVLDRAVQPLLNLVGFIALAKMRTHRVVADTLLL